MVETLTGLLALALWGRYGPSPFFFVYFYFLCSLIIITLIDLEHRIIPDEISLSGILVGFVSSFLLPNLTWIDSLIGIVMGGGLLFIISYGYLLITGQEGMGGGDIKLLAMIGAFLGWQFIPMVILISAAVGSFVGVCFMLYQKKDRHMQIPFGPFLAIGAVVALFYGKDLMRWYMGLYGY